MQNSIILLTIGTLIYLGISVESAYISDFADFITFYGYGIANIGFILKWIKEYKAKHGIFPLPNIIRRSLVLFNNGRSNN